MLVSIPRMLPSELVKAMMDMGHGDELVIADGNFPASSCGVPVIHMDGHGVPEVLDAILTLFPLDTYCAPVAFMNVMEGDTVTPEIWDPARGILRSHLFTRDIEMIERYSFYQRSRQAFVIVATSETHQYANIILKKGIVK